MASAFYSSQVIGIIVSLLTLTSCMHLLLSKGRRWIRGCINCGDEHDVSNTSCQYGIFILNPKWPNPRQFCARGPNETCGGFQEMYGFCMEDYVCLMEYTDDQYGHCYYKWAVNPLPCNPYGACVH